MTTKQMADVDAIFQEVIDGLADNSRVNNVPYSEGWDAETALSVYYTDPDMGLNADLQQKHGGVPDDAETDALIRRIAAWLDENKGRSFFDAA